MRREIISWSASTVQKCGDAITLSNPNHLLLVTSETKRLVRYWGDKHITAKITMIWQLRYRSVKSNFTNLLKDL